MTKSYDVPLESAMLALLDLLKAKASSYSWSSVCSFHGHIAKHVELWHLEWTSLSEIREKANTYSKSRVLCLCQVSHPTTIRYLQTPTLLALGSLQYST